MQERAAHEFYAQVLNLTDDPEVKAVVSEFVEEEREHVQWMLRWIAEDKANAPHDWVDALQHL
jgi:rubrerythrin